MLLYISSPVFTGRTFVISCNASDSIARLKANILHILYEMGRGSHQFRLKFKNQYLKDSSSIRDYGLSDSHVISMVPLSGKSFTANPLISSTSSLNDRVTEDTLQQMLLKEVNTLKTREKLCNNLQVCVWILCALGVVSLVTTLWYTAFYKFTAAALALGVCPKYTRLSGFYLRMNERNDLRVLFIAIGALVLCLGSAGALPAMIQDDCVFNSTVPWLHCSGPTYFSIPIYLVETVGYLFACVMAFILRRNFEFQIGNYVEPVLVEIRDIKYIFTAARSNSVKEQRTAALDLANMAASSVDNKFALVTAGGLQVLIDLALTEDEGVRGYAIEAISELLTVRSIQNEFLELGGISTLMFALNSNDNHIVKETLLAVCQIVEEGEAVIATILAENGMDDLCRVVASGHVETVRLVAGLFLDVSFSDTLRVGLLKHRKYVPYFERMVKCSDVTVQQLSLQTLEMLALSSPESVTIHTSLIPALVKNLSISGDIDVRTISCKLLLYFCEASEQARTLLVDSGIILALTRVSGAPDNIIQNISAHILRTLVTHDRTLIEEEGAVGLAKLIRTAAVDQEAWIICDQLLMRGNENAESDI